MYIHILTPYMLTEILIRCSPRTAYDFSLTCKYFFSERSTNFRLLLHYRNISKQYIQDSIQSNDINNYVLLYRLMFGSWIKMYRELKILPTIYDEFYWTNNCNKLKTKEEINNIILLYKKIKPQSCLKIFLNKQILQFTWDKYFIYDLILLFKHNLNLRVYTFLLKNYTLYATSSFYIVLCSYMFDYAATSDISCGKLIKYLDFFRHKTYTDISDQIYTDICLSNNSVFLTKSDSQYSWNCIFKRLDDLSYHKNFKLVYEKILSFHFSLLRYYHNKLKVNSLMYLFSNNRTNYFLLMINLIQRNIYKFFIKYKYNLTIPLMGRSYTESEINLFKKTFGVSVKFSDTLKFFIEDKNGYIMCENNIYNINCVKSMYYIIT